MKAIFALFALCLCADAQTPVADQQLLNEFRQLRQDLATVTATVQRTQILLFRLQLEQSALSRVQQRVDQARAQLMGIQQRLKNNTDQLRNLEEELNRTQDANQKARLPQIIANVKKDIENWGPSQEQEAQGRLIDAETQLRAEQAKNDALQAALDKIDKQLEASTARQ